MDSVLLTASSGGHLEEISNLDLVGENYEAILLTEKTDFSVSAWYDRVYYVPQVNRKELKCIPKLISNGFTALRVLRRHKPVAVISTGALATVPVCLLAKLRKIKVIYIESFARVHDRSLTGRLVYPMADLFLVQWETLLKCYPKAKYVGGIF